MVNTSINTMNGVIDNTIDGMASMVNINNVINDATKSVVHNTLDVITLVNIKYTIDMLAGFIERVNSRC